MNLPKKPIIMDAPPSPTRPPLINIARKMLRPTGIPDAAAKVGLNPTIRNSYPVLVLNINH
jgi:hypothetical protein